MHYPICDRNRFDEYPERPIFPIDALLTKDISRNRGQQVTDTEGLNPGLAEYARLAQSASTPSRGGNSEDLLLQARLHGHGVYTNQ